MRQRLPSVLILAVVFIIAAICFVWQLWRISLPWSPYPSERGLPAPMETTTQVYHSYLPLYVKSDTSNYIGIGVAGNHAQELNADWNYVWGWCDSPCTPDDMDFSVPLPSCPPRLLLGNEPEGQDPTWNRNISPELAAERSRQIRAQCPDTKFIVGNVIQGGTDWLDAYIEADGEWNRDGDRLGVHCYVWISADECINILEKFRLHFNNAPSCVTEFAVLVDSQVAAEFPRYLNYITQNFGCGAAFTDVLWGKPFGELDPSMITNGALNERGELFVNRWRGGD